MKNDRNKQLALTLLACDCCTVFLSHVLDGLIPDFIFISVAFLLCVQKAHVSSTGPGTSSPWGTFCGVLESFLAYVSVASCIRP